VWKVPALEPASTPSRHTLLEAVQRTAPHSTECLPNSLRPTTLLKAQRSPAYVPLRTGDGPEVFAHRRAYPMLVGRDIEVDCRRHLGVRSFSSSLPPDLGLRTSFGRESGGDRRESSASGADAPPN
jgi:hypothetical protein